MIAKKLGCLDYTYVHVYIYMYIYVHCIYMYTVYILKAALWAPTFWAVSFCHFSPWIYPSRKKNMAALVTSTLHLPQANPKNKIPYTKLNSITENRKKQKTKIPEKGWGAHSCWISVFFVFFCFVFFCFFFVFFWVFSGSKGRMQRVESFHAPREGCRELSLVICFSSCQSMHMSKQRMYKEECKKRTLTVPCSGERGTVRVRFFHWCCIKISYICQRCCCKISSIWYVYIYMHTSKISSSWVTRNKTYCTCTARN